jgi:hypothetical protein
MLGDPYARSTADVSSGLDLGLIITSRPYVSMAGIA